MSTTSALSSPKLSKKELRKLLFDKISGALAEYREGMKEKRFTSNLKKASKLFAADIAKTIGKKKEKAPKKVKEKTKKLHAAEPAVKNAS